VPVVDDATVSVEIPDPPEDSVTLDELRLAVRPEEGDTVVESVTGPAKLLMLARLIVAVAEEPDWNDMLDGLELMLKSGVGGGGEVTVTATLVVCTIGPLVPVTVTVYDPGDDEARFRVDDALPPADNPTLVGLRAVVTPDGEEEAESETVPEKLLMLARLIVEVPEDPDWKVRLDGFDEMLKSGGGGAEFTVTAKLVEWTTEPLVPVTVTVYEPAAADDKARVAVPVPPADNVTLEELRVVVKPEGVLVLDRETVPEKLFRLDRVIVEVAVPPAVKLRVEGLADMPRSGVGVVVLKNSVIGEAPASPVDSVASPQLA